MADFCFPVILTISSFFICNSNERVSSIIATKSYGGKAVPDLLVGLMARDRPCDMQLAAATALTFLHRAGALSADDPKVIFKTLQCLVSFKCDFISYK